MSAPQTANQTAAEKGGFIDRPADREKVLVLVDEDYGTRWYWRTAIYDAERDLFCVVESGPECPASTHKWAPWQDLCPWTDLA